MNRASPPSTASTAVPSEHSPLMSESGTDATMRDGSGADWEGGSDHWSSAASEGTPLADSPAQQVERMYRRAVSANERAWGEHGDGASEQRSSFGGDGDSESGSDARKPPVGRWRGVSICLSIWVLLFLQGAS